MLFKRPEVVLATKEILVELINTIISPLVGGNRDGLAEINPRFFLAAYMITINPAAVFDQITPQTAELKRASDKITRQFNAITEALTLVIEDPSEENYGIHVLQELSRNFCVNYHDYHTKFHAWQRLDANNLITRIKGSLHALLAAMFLLAENSPPDVDLIHQGTDPRIIAIKTHIDRLRAKMVQIGRTAYAADIAEFDAKMASDMQRYRMLRIMREEMRRHGGDGNFDFIES